MLPLSGRMARFPGCTLTTSEVGCSVQKQGTAEQSSPSVVHQWCPVCWISVRTHSAVRGTESELGAIALLCLYEAAAPAQAGMTPSFLPLCLDHWSGAMNQEKDILPKKQRERIRNSWALNSRNSLSSNPSFIGNDKELAQPKAETKDLEMSWSDLQCLLSPVVPLRQLLNIVNIPRDRAWFFLEYTCIW